MEDGEGGGGPDGQHSAALPGGEARRHPERGAGIVPVWVGTARSKAHGAGWVTVLSKPLGLQIKVFWVHQRSPRISRY